jgi:hypothetical protein
MEGGDMPLAAQADARGVGVGVGGGGCGEGGICWAAQRGWVGWGRRGVDVAVHRRVLSDTR